MSQEFEDRLTTTDLMYLKVAIAVFQANLDMKIGMPNAYAAMQPLKEKIDRIYSKMVNEE